MNDAQKPPIPPAPPSPQPPTPPPPQPPAARPAPKKPPKSIQQVEVDETKVWNLWFTRREFLTLAAWGAFLAGLAGSALAALRFFIPNVAYDPPSVFKVGRPEDYLPGEVSSRFKKKYRIWIARDLPSNGGGVYCIYARCTHLGCTPNWLTGQNKFKCPCHGSGFRWGGINFEGPAPRPLERCKIVLAADGQIQVDISTRYKNPKDWKTPAAYLKV